MLTKHRPFRELSHTADAGIEARGKDLEEAFQNTARGMIYLSGAKCGDSRQTKKINISAPDIESRLIDFLNEILYLLNEKKWVAKRIMCRHSGNSMWAELMGAPVLSENPGLREIKAATYHNLSLEHKKDNWEIRVFFDL